jgi:iron complex outermembrane receptor protein
VVNIITKQGADVDGLQAKAGVGNYGQVRADAVFGKRYFDLDMLVWGSVYRSSGEQRNVADERKGEGPYDMPLDEVRLGRIGTPPTYDFGLQLSCKGLRFLYDTHFSQVVAPFTITSLALSYDHDRYRTYNGLLPGFSTASRHAELSYEWYMGKVQWKVSATYDKSDLTRYQVINDETMPTLGTALGLPEEMSAVFAYYGGISRYVNGQEQDYGAQLKGNYS